MKQLNKEELNKSKGENLRENMQEKKKKIIIVCSVVALIVILGGIYLCFFTDLCKSNRSLFLKYIEKSLEAINYEENTKLVEISNLKEQMPYETKGMLSIDAEQINTKIDLNIESKTNKIEEKNYTKANLLYNNQDIFELEYAHSNNIYAVKSNEIVSAFLGIENDNLKVLAQKLGINNTTMIPNSIENVNLNEILAISEEEKEHIIETYMPVILENIGKANFTKEKNIAVIKNDLTYNATGYRLNLSNEELKQIYIAILQTLSEDSITLNLITTKAKLLDLSDEYTQINMLTKTIQEEIENLNDEIFSIEDGISVIVYVNNKNVILTEVILRNKIKYTVYGNVTNNQRSCNMIIENLNTTTQFEKVEIEFFETEDDEKVTQNIMINSADDLEINVYIENGNITSKNNQNTSVHVNIIQKDFEAEIGYEQETYFVEEMNDIIELTRNNCGVLNDYTTEQIQNLILSISERVNAIIEEKKQIIGLNGNVYAQEDI